MDIDPAVIARAEQQEFLVENILAHRKTPGSNNKRTDFEFLVKWRGYDEANNTWEPWEFVRDNDKLLVYLYQNRLKQFLTKEQKLEAEQLIQHV